MKFPTKLHLANLPTPIQQVEYKNTKFLIKRDDYTGSEFSGNKIRKLEYLLVDAKRKKAGTIFTCGGEQSNHCRATVLAASKLGIKTKLFLWGKKRKHATGNLLISNIMDVETEFLTLKQYKNVNSIMAKQSDLRKASNEKVYIIPTGGSNAQGVWGYINFVEEISKQPEFKKSKGILCANGSGGTIAGILLGFAIKGIRKKIFGVNVIGDAKEMIGVINSIVEECLYTYKLKVKADYSLLELMDGYSNEGYKRTSPEKVCLIKDFARQTGIILDPTYTGKAFYAYNEIFLGKNKRNNILFIHTGGLFGIFAKSKLFFDN